MSGINPFSDSSNTIISLEEIDGKRVIHFLAYGYFADGGEEKDCRLVEYTFFYAKIEDVLSYGFSKYESDYSDVCKQYITDCTLSELEEMYGHYDAGKAPGVIREKDLANAPLGVYEVIAN